MEKQKIPLGAKKHLLGIFFDNLNDSERITHYLELIERRGYDTDSFYWMSPELKPKPYELEEILIAEEYELTKEEIEEYISRYKESYKENV